MLVEDRGTAPELSEVRRFRESWERRASVELRVGSAVGGDAYLAHDRVSDGSRDEMLGALYRAWKHDTLAGRVSLMNAQDAATAVELKPAGAAGPPGCRRRSRARPPTE